MKSKNLNRTLSKCALTILAALIFAACSDYDNGYTEQQLKFIQGFKDVFGEIDHTQDWNLAERGTVTVTTPQPSRIKIYAKTFGTYKLVGDYEDVSGTQTLGFDMVEGTTSILVSDGKTSHKTMVGESVVFSGTRYTYTDENSAKNADGSDIVQTEGFFTHFDAAYANAVIDVLPEEDDNRNKVTNNFSYISQGPFTIYPIYAQTSSSHILGVYWKGDDGTLHTQHVYRTSIGNSGAGDEGDEYRPNYKTDEEGNFIVDEDKHISGSVQSKGVIINLPKGTQFGIYLEVYENYPTFSHCIYSEEDLNEIMAGNSLDGKVAISGIGGKNVRDEFVFGATFRKTITTADEKGNSEIHRNVQFLCFEDWNIQGPDYNDLVFTFKGVSPTIVEESGMSWVLSCEDLGGSFDLDYNDVVVEVNYISGRDKATVTPLAAGGTLASYLYYNDGTEDQYIGEIHQLFDPNITATSGNYTPINVSNETPDISADPIEIKIKDPKNWRLSSFSSKEREENEGSMSDQFIDGGQHQTMGGFYIKVLHEGENGNNEYAYSKIQNETTKTSNNVPYIICTPMTWQRRIDEEHVLIGDYRWPKEHVAMYDIEEGFTGSAYHNVNYPEYSFHAWIKGDHSETSKYWYAYPYTTDDNHTFPNTCANDKPRIVAKNGETGELEPDDEDDENYYKTDPDLHADELELCTDDNEKYYDLNISPTNNEYTITIKSKSGAIPTISPQKGNAWNFIYYNGVEGAIAETPWVYKDIIKGYYTWTFTISCNSLTDDEYITISQPQSTQYTESEIKIRLHYDHTNINPDDLPSVKVIIDKTEYIAKVIPMEAMNSAPLYKIDLSGYTLPDVTNKTASITCSNSQEIMLFHFNITEATMWDTNNVQIVTLDNSQGIPSTKEITNNKLDKIFNTDKGFIIGSYRGIDTNITFTITLQE